MGRRNRNQFAKAAGLRMAGKKGTHRMPMCEYGAGCTRRGCIYRHPPKGEKPSKIQVACRNWLMGECEFGRGCRYLHPPGAKGTVAAAPAPIKLTASSSTWTPGGYAAPAPPPPPPSQGPSVMKADGADADFAAYLAASRAESAATSTLAAASVVPPTASPAGGDAAFDGDADFLQYLAASRPTDPAEEAAAAAAAAAATAAAAPDGPSFGLAARLKITELCSRFPMVPADSVASCFAAHGTDVRRTVAALHEIFGAEYDVLLEERAASAEARRVAAIAAASAAARPAARPAPLAAAHANALRGHDAAWVESGAAVAKDYAELRGEATQQSILRNKFFEQATAAYNRGDAARAKKLSSIGKGHQAKAQALHAAAARAILAKRTAALEPSARATTLDLHGLHVGEAHAALAERLPQIAAAGYRTAVVITGAGEFILFTADIWCESC